MPLIKLFLSLFKFMLFFVTRRKRLLHVVYLQTLAIRALTRTLGQKGIRVSFEPHEKYIIATLFKETPGATSYFPFVSPKTILTIWKNAIAKRWSHPHKGSGRKPVSNEVKELILKLKKENALWGTRRIRDELCKLSFSVSHETISKIVRHFRKIGDIKPVLSWKRFLSSHWNSLFACDFFTADIFGFKRFYVFFIVELKTRKIIQYSITPNPTISFLRNQFSVFEYEYPGSYLIHDNSGELRWFPYDQYNFKDVRIVPYSPDMNAYAERFVPFARNV